MSRRGISALRAVASTSRADLTTAIVDPLTDPVLDTRVVAAGKLASGIGASVQIGLTGPEDAIRFKSGRGTSGTRAAAISASPQAGR